MGNRFEREALHIDSRIAEPSDLTFLLYVKGLRWALTDATLFAGVEGYTEDVRGDHFYVDGLREMCAAMYRDDHAIRFGEFEDDLPSEPMLDALKFFDGMTEETFRWERLVAFRLLLLGFINSFGYRHQWSPQEHFDEVARKITHPQVAAHLGNWLPKLGLGDDGEARKIQLSLEKLLAPVEGATASH